MGLFGSRRALFVREIVRSNGDTSAFVFEEGLLIHANRREPAILAASDVAVHVIETETRHSAVCSYNRVVRFDHRDAGADVLVGICCYMGTTPTLHRLAMGTDLEPCELANYLLRLPRSYLWSEVCDRIEAGVELRGIPADAHAIVSFV